jgi:beta-mannosidase
VLDQESQSIIKRLRKHACLVLWCGGNELFNNWSLMTNQDLALRLLNRNCYDLDPERPFLMTSPIMGMGHGHYLFRDPQGREVFQLFANARCTAYTEFGCPGPASLQTLRRIIPENELFPPRRGTSWVSHHAFDAWGADAGSWLMLHQIEDYFGACSSIEDVVERGQLLQGEGYKCIFEEARRQKPTAAMALNWCLNEPWPTAANNSLLSWPAEPKRAYAQVSRACRPVLASARIVKFRWRAGELFNPELWLLNDAPESAPAGRIDAQLICGDQKFALLSWDFPALEPNTNLAGPVIRFTLPMFREKQMKLILSVPGHPELDSEYTLVFVPPAQPKEASGARALNL